MALTPSAERPLIDKVARWTTLVGVALCPFIGVPIGDMLLLMALLMRGLQLLTTGLALRELRNHDSLLGVFAAIAVGGMLSGVVHGQPMPWELLRLIIATVGSVLVIATFGTSRSDLQNLVRALAVGVALLALTACFMPRANGRIYGFAIHPNLLGHSCVMGFTAALAAWDWSRSRRMRGLWTACMAVTLVGLFLSGSRGSLLGFILAAILYLALSGQRRLVLLSLAGSYLVVTLLAAGVMGIPGDSALGRLLGDDSSKGANLARAQGLDDTIDILTDDPVFGAGFRVVILVHNVYLAAWVGGGVLAGAAVLLLGMAMLALPFGRPRAVLALACGATAIAVAWCLTNIFSTRDQWVFLILAFRLARSVPDPAPGVEPEPLPLVTPLGGLRPAAYDR